MAERSAHPDAIIREDVAFRAEDTRTIPPQPQTVDFPAPALEGACWFKITATIFMPERMGGVSGIKYPRVDFASFKLGGAWDCDKKCNVTGPNFAQSKVAYAIAGFGPAGVVEYDPSVDVAPGAICRDGLGHVLKWGGRFKAGLAKFSIKDVEFDIGLNVTAEFQVGYKLCCCQCEGEGRVKFCGCCVYPRPGVFGSNSNYFLRTEVIVEGEGECALDKIAYVFDGNTDTPGRWKWNAKKKDWEKIP